MNSLAPLARITHYKGTLTKEHAVSLLSQTEQEAPLEQKKDQNH